MLLQGCGGDPNPYKYLHYAQYLPTLSPNKPKEAVIDLYLSLQRELYLFAA